MTNCFPVRGAVDVAFRRGNAVTHHTEGGTMKSSTILKGSVLVAVAIAVVPFWFHNDFPRVSAAGPTRFSGPMSSQPLALNADDTLLAVANPDNNTITLFNVTGGQNVPVTEVSVGSEPN